jgi:uncharacterized protein
MTPDTIPQASNQTPGTPRPDHNTLTPDILLHLAKLLNIPLTGLAAVITLLDEGGTVPFIARYRKEATGNLDEVQIRDIEEKLAYFRDLAARRATILGSIQDQGKLTDELRKKIESTLDKSELEDLYLPYRPKRRTKATIARERGLEPLALYLWNQTPTTQPLNDFAQTFLNPEKEVHTVEDAFEGARHIVAELLSESAEIRKSLRTLMFNEGIVVSRKSTDAELKDTESKFAMYYDFREPAKAIPSHRMLAIRRGEDESILYFLIELEPERATAILRKATLKTPGDWTPHLELAIEDAWKRLLNPSIQGELRLDLKKRSDTDAIQVFRENLHHLLLAPPAGPISVLGIDPGLRTGCKVAVVDETGKFLANEVLYLHQSKGAADTAAKTLESLITKYNVRAIAIGNGTASRETDAFIRDFLRDRATTQPTNIFSVTVSESGASIYSASDIARQEFPDLDLTVRGAISIARRLQDPLSELVKVDPKSIGVGQYQHDVDQRQLQQSLETVIETCVNRVGVDLNTSSWTLLRYVAGITERTALAIVAYRDENGRFRSRAQLKKVPGIGPKSFEQAAGFLRIRNGDNPLDATAVHPESYPIVEQIAQSLATPIPTLIQTPELLAPDRLAKADLKTLQAGSFTIKDILEELRKPGRDPRDQFVAPTFSDSVREFADVIPDMVLEGVVTNVTKFGAFVDIGVHQDGLVHISELSNRFIKDPSEAVKAGQIVKVKVLSADAKSKRIGLSMKALMAPSQSQQRPPHQQPGRPTTPSAAVSAHPHTPTQQRPTHQQTRPTPKPPQPKGTLEDKLAQLSTRWRVS